LEFPFSQITKFSQKKGLHNREIWQYFQKTKVKMWSLENQKKKKKKIFFSLLKFFSSQNPKFCLKKKKG